MVLHLLLVVVDGPVERAGPVVLGGSTRAVLVRVLAARTHAHPALRERVVRGRTGGGRGRLGRLAAGLLRGPHLGNTVDSQRQRASSGDHTWGGGTQWTVRDSGHMMSTRR